MPLSVAVGVAAHPAEIVVAGPGRKTRTGGLEEAAGGGKNEHLGPAGGRWLRLGGGGHDLDQAIPVQVRRGQPPHLRRLIGGRGVCRRTGLEEQPAVSPFVYAESK